MKIQLCILLFFLSCISVHSAYSQKNASGNIQSSYDDSLRAILKTAREDSNKVKTLNKLSDNLKNEGDYKASAQYAEESAKLAEKINFQVGQINAIVILGTLHNRQGEPGKALERYQSALRIAESIKDTFRISNLLGGMGNAYKNQGDFPKGLEYYLRSLKLAEIIKEKAIIERQFGNIGIVYVALHDYQKALDYYTKALKMAEESGNRSSVARHLNNIGIVYDEQKEFGKALDYYSRSIKIKEETGDLTTIAADYGNLGNVYADMGNREKALEYFNKALKKAEELGDKKTICINTGNIGLEYLKQDKYTEAERYFLTAIKFAEEGRLLSSASELHFLLSKTYSGEKQWQKALSHYKMYISEKDSLMNEENTKKTVRLEMNYEFEKKEAATKLEQEKKEAVAAAESRKQKIIIWSVCGILLLVVAFAIFAYRSFLQKKKANIEITRQKHVIEEKQKEILDSIYYARRIQRALLTSERYITRNLTKLIHK